MLPAEKNPNEYLRERWQAAFLFLPPAAGVAAPARITASFFDELDLCGKNRPGSVDFEITWKADIFTGAPQESNAAAFGTQGINFRARKPDTDS